jgi:hypothetical protein
VHGGAVAAAACDANSCDALLFAWTDERGTTQAVTEEKAFVVCE